MFLLAEINPQEFFTWGSLTTLAGATGVVYIVCGVIQSVFNFNPKWFALLFSIAVSFVGMAIAQSMHSAPHDDLPAWVRNIITFLNGFLIYASSVGTNQLAAPKKPGEPPMRSPAPGGTPARDFQREVFPQKKRRGFKDSWLK